MKNTDPKASPETAPGVGSSAWLDIISQSLTLHDLLMVARFLYQPIVHQFLVACVFLYKFVVKLRYGFLCRLTELRMMLLKTRMICLKRGYLTGNEPNLRTYRVLCRACVHHPVKVVNVFLECFHIVRVSMRSNDPSSATRPTRALDCNLDAMAGLAAAHG